MTTRESARRNVETFDDSRPYPVGAIEERVAWLTLVTLVEFITSNFGEGDGS
jgi:hypothetical protein